MNSTELVTAYINYENNLRTENKEARLILISVPYLFSVSSNLTFVVPVKERSGCQGSVRTTCLNINFIICWFHNVACPRAKLVNFVTSYHETRLTWINLVITKVRWLWNPSRSSKFPEKNLETSLRNILVLKLRLAEYLIGR